MPIYVTVRKIEVATDIPTEFELGNTAADIHWRTEEREVKEREKEAQKQREEARRMYLHTQQRREWQKKHARTDRSDTKMDTEAGGEATTSQFHSRQKRRRGT